MRIARLGRKSFCVAVCLAGLHAQTLHINLRQWGYAPPARRPELLSREGVSSPKFIAVCRNHDVVVAFITRKGPDLATREEPALTLHAITVSEEGKLLSQKEFPAFGWYENSIFLNTDGDLLVRTGNKLNLFSKSGDPLAERQLDGDAWPVLLPFLNRQGMILFRHWQVEAIDLQSLTTVRQCSYPNLPVLSVSDRAVLVRFPIDATDPKPHRVQIDHTCGPIQFDYKWGPTPNLGNVTLLDDTRFVISDGPFLELVQAGARRWSDYFNRKHERIHGYAQADASGAVFGVVVGRYNGGNDFLDVDAHLGSIKIVVYDAKTGKRLVATPVDHLPSLVFDFSMSPDGKLLAVLSDGDLQLVPVPPP